MRTTPPERGITKRKCSEDTKSSSNWKLESRNENVAGDSVPEVKGKWGRGESTCEKADGRPAVNESDAKGGIVNSSRGRGGTRGHSSGRTKASREQHPHHGHRAKGQGAQLLDRSPGAEDRGQRCPNLETDMETEVHQATPKSVGGRETTCRKPLEAVLHETRSQDQEQGSRAREAKGAQKDSRKETQAGAEGGQPGWRARKPRKALPGGRTRENSGCTGRPARATQESRQSKHKDRTDAHPLQEGLVAGGQQDSGLAASGQPQAQCTLSSPRAPSFPVRNW